MNSIRISIQANEVEQELLISELMDLNPDGFEQSVDSLVVYFPEMNFNSYEVQQLLGERKIEISTVAEQNWNKVWESNFEPVIIGDFCVVRADFHTPAEGVEHEIIITPKMSFGTGHHATTYMMAERMKDIDFNNKKVFDFGTGTGILAILAEKMGASEVIAVDIDDWSIENAADNISRNGCANILLQQSDTITGGEYDVVLANINRNILLGHADALTASLKKGGLILLSGLLADDEDDISKAYMPKGLILENRSERNNWIALLYRSTL